MGSTTILLTKSRYASELRNTLLTDRRVERDPEDDATPQRRRQRPAFDADAASKALRAETAAIRKARLRRSRLDPHTRELLELRDRGHTAAELQRWLRHDRRVRVAHSTVARWLKRHGH